MITRVMIEINIDRDSYQGELDLEEIVIDELSDLMRSDILASAQVDLVDIIGGTMVVITNA